MVTYSHPSRRTFAAGVSAMAGATLLGGAIRPTTAHAASDQDSGSSGKDSVAAGKGPWAKRADLSNQALQRYFLVPDDTGLYRERYPSGEDDRPYSYEWPFSQAHVAALDLTGMRNAPVRYQRSLERHTRAQLRYWSKSSTTGLPGFASYPLPPLGEGGDLFYDDNEWVGLLDVQQWLMYRDLTALRQARRMFNLVVSGWDRDRSHASPGGVFWTQAPWSTDRNTVSNMPGAELGLRLHQISGGQRHLDWSLRMYRWTNRWLQRPDGLYHDHLSLTGEVEKTIWSYNQGVPVGVNVLLADVTGKRRYLDEAVRIAEAAHDYFADEGRLAKQPPFFNSIFFKNLLLLESATGGSTYRRRMIDWADQVWEERRDSATGLFRFHDDDEATDMIEQAAMVQVYAVLAWPAHRLRLLY